MRDGQKKKVSIPYDKRSAVVWPSLFSRYTTEIDKSRAAIRELNSVLDQDYEKMEYKTGTITEASGFCLYLMARFFMPLTIFEIGTLIG